MLVEPAGPTFEQNCIEIKPTLPLAAAESPFSQKNTKIFMYDLDATIDNGAYPGVEAKRSNIGHRPIGIGVQGLADAFMMLRAPFDSEAAAKLNRDIFETIYYGALEATIDLARENGIKDIMCDARLGPHDSYEGSPASRGILQPEMWGVQTDDTMWDWTRLRADLKEHGCFIEIFR